ncbi:oligosaccharide flippase family protein [Metapseudomonas lalkuanensis]|uniref:Oligosaccharide flippase family protein n=1 Tax=Metapseudomonas lalkuanensis TaxID=2604832 RepID=A0A5J6QHK0_9GAMM|nr:oligosaccharide flippase family protein [Pseudomonas lalkuanensis]QEY62228.1 oligosaccharide flippase family protein [Pseudomonas lalkuanensis]
MSQMRLSLFASLVSKLSYAISNFLALPLYTKFLGMESVGLIGFFVMLQMILMALDGGMTSAFTRKLSSMKRFHSYAPVRYLSLSSASLSAHFLIFGILGMFFGGGVYFFARDISEEWLVIQGLEFDLVVRCVEWMGGVVFLGFISLILQAYLVAREMLVINGILFSVYSISRTLGVVLFVYAFEIDSSELNRFFEAQFLVHLFYVVALVVVCLRSSERVFIFRPSFGSVFRDGRFQLGVFFVSISSIVVVQIDKIYLSKMIDLTGYGYYTLAASLASLPYIFSSALYPVIYPKFSALVSAGEQVRILRIYTASSCALIITLLLASLFVFCYSASVLELFFSDEIISNIAPLLSPLFLGTAIQSLLIVPFALQLAHGLTAFSLNLNLVLAPIMAMALFYLVGRYGVAGAAWVWLGYNVLSFIVTCIYVVSRLQYIQSAAKTMFLATVSCVVAFLFFNVVYEKISPMLSNVESLLLLFVSAVLLMLSQFFIFRKTLAGFN